MRSILLFLSFSLCFVFCKTPEPPKAENLKKPKVNTDDQMGKSNNGMTMKSDGVLTGYYEIREIMGKTVKRGLGPNINIDEKQGRVKGFTSCNSYEATLKADARSFKVSGLGATEKGCESDKMEVEGDLYTAFRKAHSYRFESTYQLEILGFDRSVLMICVKDQRKK